MAVLDVPAAPAPDTISPELALVDPTLRAAACERLGDPGDTHLRLASAARVAAESAPPAEHVEPESWPPDGVAEAAVRRLAESALAAEAAETAETAVKLPRRLPRVTVIVAAASAGFAVALLAADRELDRERSVSPVSSMTTQPVVTETERAAFPVEPAEAPSAAPGRRATPPVRTPQRFAWAPVSGATAYHVELYRGPARVFAADTNRPMLTIPSSWRFAGRRYRLEAVEYRWYVWPILSGRRTAKAVVQARLVVRDR